MCSFVTQHNATDVSSLRECAIGMLTAGMTTITVARELNVNFSTIIRFNIVLDYFEVHPSGLTTADHVYGVVWASGLLSSEQCAPW